MLGLKFVAVVLLIGAVAPTQATPGLLSSPHRQTKRDIKVTVVTVAHAGTPQPQRVTIALFASWVGTGFHGRRKGFGGVTSRLKERVVKGTTNARAHVGKVLQPLLDELVPGLLNGSRTSCSVSSDQKRMHYCIIIDLALSIAVRSRRREARRTYSVTALSRNFMPIEVGARVCIIGHQGPSLQYMYLRNVKQVERLIDRADRRFVWRRINFIGNYRIEIDSALLEIVQMKLDYAKTSSQSVESTSVEPPARSGLGLRWPMTTDVTEPMPEFGNVVPEARYGKSKICSSGLDPKGGLPGNASYEDAKKVIARGCDKGNKIWGTLKGECSYDVP
ncbi:hypothetical protein EVAR_47865_1 [Eumeta japonica]|uniref:Uncharacterized protein n=1 Tax=Eumeta variegata TaxID=151549 RepID=A0A4C1ZZ15_EUMVA|nr:hypothetical protein EVAR_47865_1 [Eumeta japonica]